MCIRFLYVRSIWFYIVNKWRFANIRRSGRNKEKCRKNEKICKRHEKFVEYKKVYGIRKKYRVEV